MHRACRGRQPLGFSQIVGVLQRLSDWRWLPSHTGFLNDFERTKTELFVERMWGKTAELAHRDGLSFSGEPYGSRLDPVERVPKVDQPIDTFCHRPPKGTFSLIATYAGKPLVGRARLCVGGA